MADRVAGVAGGRRHVDDRELEEIGRRAEGMAEEADTVRVMFNNNRGADAPQAAERMRELLGQETGVA